MRIYLDHNGTSPMVPEARELLLQLMEQDLGNASATHSSGRRARAIIDDARAEVAEALGVPEESVLFTSGGTESNNLSLRGVIESAGPNAGMAISAVEHSSVLEPARDLESRGAALQVVPVDPIGAIDMDALRAAVEAPGCALLSVMTANNEVGSVSPMDEIAECLAALGKKRPIWHTDAVQALGKLPLRLREWGADLVSFSAHKVGGPLGVGVLLRRPGLDLHPLALGGGQESGVRAGTENAAAIASAALAIRLACEAQEEYAKRVMHLSTALWEGLRKALPGARLLGPELHAERRLPNTLNVLFDGVDGRTLVARLDLEGVEVSQGSACSSGAIEASHVLVAMGLDPREARSGLRLSLGACTTSGDIHRAVDILGKVIREPS